MNTYKVKLDIEAEIQAFNIDDASEYVRDVFGLDEEVKSVKLVSIKEK